MLAIKRQSKFFTSQDKDMKKQFSIIQVCKPELYFLNSLIDKLNRLTKSKYNSIDLLNLHIKNVHINILCECTDNIRILISDFIINSETKNVYFIIDRILNENTGEIISERKITVELFKDDINTNFLDNFTIHNFEIFNIFKDLKFLSSPMGLWINCSVI